MRCGVWCSRHAALCDVMRHCTGARPLLPERHRKYVLQISNAGPSGMHAAYGQVQVRSFYAVARMHPFALLFVHIITHNQHCSVNLWHETPTLSAAVMDRFVDVLKHTLCSVSGTK
jgi:hypothetical protein